MRRTLLGRIESMKLDDTDLRLHWRKKNVLLQTSLWSVTEPKELPPHVLLDFDVKVPEEKSDEDGWLELYSLARPDPCMS
jgi:hypothetical protein